jgi:NADPH:quinone reductase-like Zn-dependent oxidoreductase
MVVGQIGDIDVALEAVGRGYAERSLPTLRPGGVMVTSVTLFKHPINTEGRSILSNSSRFVHAWFMFLGYSMTYRHFG